MNSIHKYMNNTIPHFIGTIFAFRNERFIVVKEIDAVNVNDEQAIPLFYSFTFIFLNNCTIEVDFKVKFF